MNRLEGGMHFLRLCSYDNPLRHFLEAFDSHSAALQSWGPRLRISPIFSLNGAPRPDFRSIEHSWALFAGPIRPAELAAEPDHLCYLTVGLYNVLIISQSKKAADGARAIATAGGFHWEEWRLAAGELVEVEFSHTLDIASQAVSPMSTPTGLEGASAAATLQEYFTTVSNSYSRIAPYLPKLGNDVAQFHSAFHELLSSEELDSVTKIGQLITADAALSRHCDQVASGTSPILETEGQFASHSLLGSGVGVMALVHVRRFIEEILREVRIQDRVSAFDIVPNQGTLFTFNDSHDFWGRDHLFHYPEVDRVVSAASSEPDHALPLVTFFSGRDGFRSTELSLSAPWEVIGSCNTTAWTAHTLTHEIAHVIVESCLSALMPITGLTFKGREQELEEYRLIMEWFGSHSEPNFLAQLRTYLCWGIYHLSGGQTKGISPQGFSHEIKSVYREAQEVLTHTLDFLYFYGKDVSSYIKSVWASWAVIPDIQHRIPQYLIRCGAAVSAIHIRRDNAPELAVANVLSALQETRTLFPDALYIPDAIEQLEADGQHFVSYVNRCRYLVRLARAVLYSPTVADRFNREVDVAGGEKGEYDFPKLAFTEQRVTNPLRFIEEYSRAAVPDPTKSVWMLQHLAFERT